MIVGKVQRFETRRGVVEFFDIGTGLPTLYFHGTGAAGDAALLLEQSLLQSDCRLIVPNRPGYYGASLGLVGSAEYCADLAADVLDHLAINRTAVIGTSGGGMQAATFARCHPDRTAALILQCAQSHQWDSAKWLPKGLGPALFLFRSQLFRPFLRWQNMRHAKAGHQKPISVMQHMTGRRFPELCDDIDVLQQARSLPDSSQTSAAVRSKVSLDRPMCLGRPSVACQYALGPQNRGTLRAARATDVPC